MAVVIVNNIEGGSQEMYDNVNPKVMPDGKLPDGCQFHVAGPVDGGWRVITVWDSEDQFQKFREDTLMPAMKEAGEEGRIAPQIDADPAYNVIAS